MSGTVGTWLTLTSPLHPTLYSHGEGWGDTETEKAAKEEQEKWLESSLLCPPPSPSPPRTPHAFNWDTRWSAEERTPEGVRPWMAGKMGLSRTTLCVPVKEPTAESRRFELTHLILVSHCVQLLQLLSPVTCLLFRDVCRQSHHALGLGTPGFPPSLGPRLSGEQPGKPQEWVEVERAGSQGLQEIVRTLKAKASSSSVPEWALWPWVR